MTAGRSLVKAVDSYQNYANGTYIVLNECEWQPKLTTYQKQNYCLDVREPNTRDKVLVTKFGGAPKYLIWSKLSNQFMQCTDVYITAPYENERYMFDIFYADDDYFYSPSCCFIANDNVNIPFVDDGLTICKCTQHDINVIEDKPVIKKGSNS